MSLYRKKPVVIEAFLWTGGPDQVEDPEWAAEAVRSGIMSFHRPTVTAVNVVECHIKTLEGVMVASRGDWIIRGIKGEIYPCKPDIFRVTYEPVEDK
jgi:hypothetical protein